MTSKILEGAKQALAYVKGDTSVARETHYVGRLRRPTVDQGSYDLAEKFLRDEPNLQCEEATWDLAGTIQLAVEAWFEHQRLRLEQPRGEP